MQKTIVLNLTAVMMLIAAFFFSVGPARAGAPQNLAMHLEAYNRDYPVHFAQNGPIPQTSQMNYPDSVVSEKVDWNQYVFPITLGAAIVAYMLYAAHKKSHTH